VKEILGEIAWASLLHQAIFVPLHTACPQFSQGNFVPSGFKIWIKLTPRLVLDDIASLIERKSAHATQNCAKGVVHRRDPN